MRCIGHNGRLLEIGKYDILKGTQLSMKPMLNNIAYEGIDVDRVMNSKDTAEVCLYHKEASHVLRNRYLVLTSKFVYPRT